MADRFWTGDGAVNGWANLAQVAAPATLPLTLADAKAQCRVDHPDDDNLLQSLIAAAVAQIDGPRGIGVCLIQQQWRLSLDRWPTPAILIPLGPVVSIDQIQFYPFGGSGYQTLDPSLYSYDLNAQLVRVRRAPFVVWPILQPIPGAVHVEFTCGFGEAQANVPADLQHALRLLVSHWYEHRDAVVGVENRDSSTIMPLGVDAILDRYRAGRFA